MLLRLKICFTIFALYEIAAITLLYCQRTCDAMFSTAFCDTEFKYFIWAVAVPVLIYLVAMWLREIFMGRRHSFARRARHAVRGLVDNVREHVTENISTQDLEKMIAAAIVVAVKKYADNHPRTRAAFKDIIDGAEYEYDDAADDVMSYDEKSGATRNINRKKSGTNGRKRK